MGCQNFLLISCVFEIWLWPLPTQTTSIWRTGAEQCLKLDETFSSKNTLIYFENIKFHLWCCAMKIGNPAFHREAACESARQTKGIQLCEALQTNATKIQSFERLKNNLVFEPLSNNFLRRRCFQKQKRSWEDRFLTVGCLWFSTFGSTLRNI